MAYRFPFGEYLRPLVQEDRSPKKVFVLGVYASAVHARWTRGGAVICQALAVASEPRIFWDGDPAEAAEELFSQRRQTPGSTAFVPSVDGLIIAGEVVKDLIGLQAAF